MKRPLPVYLIALWCFLALGYQSGTLIDLVRSHLSEEQIPKDLWRSFRGFAIILVIWHSVRLAQLKSFNRWFSVVFFVWWTLAMAWNCFVLFHRFHNPLRTIGVLSAYAALNTASAYYLSRPSFRQFAVQFVAEREKEKNARDMQRISQKKVLNDPKS